MIQSLIFAGFKRHFTINGLGEGRPTMRPDDDALLFQSLEITPDRCKRCIDLLSQFVNASHAVQIKIVTNLRQTV